MKKALTVLMAATFLLACYAPVYAADWDLYGSARVNTFWTDYDEDRVNDPDADFNDTTRLDHDLQENARIGANVDAGDLSGRFEYGTVDGSADVRLLYGQFNLAGGEVTVGKDYGPFAIHSFISTQVYGDDINLLYHVPYTGRQPMVKFNTDTFSIALVKANETGFDARFDVDNQDDDDAGVSPEVQLPQLQASYNMDMEGAALDFVGALQSYDLEGGDGETLTAWGLGFNARLTMMDPAYVNFGGYYGQNAGDFGQLGLTQNNYDGSIDGSANDADSTIDDIEDTGTFGVGLVVGADIETMRLEAGLGYELSDNDLWDEDDEAMSYYAQAVIPIIGNATITPEIGYYDFMDDENGNDEGDSMYAGVQWRVDF